MKVKSVLFVVVAVALLATACGGPAAPGASGGKLRVAVVMPSATTDLAFSQSMFQALKSVQKDMGGEAQFEIKYSENMFNVPDAAAALRDYASQGFDIVIGHGSQYGASIQEIAKDFPKVTFAWGTDVNTFGLPNVYAYVSSLSLDGKADYRAEYRLGRHLYVAGSRDRDNLFHLNLNLNWEFK